MRSDRQSESAVESQRTESPCAESQRTPRRSSWIELDGLEDAELVALSRSGNGQAYECLYRRYAAYALSLSVRVQGYATDAEDIVHDAFLRVRDRLDTLRDDASFKAWLSSIVVRLVRTRMRRRRLLSVLGLSGGEEVDLDAVVSEEAGPELRTQLSQVYAVLASVPVDQRICFVLRYIQGYKLEEVADLAGCSLATAKRRIAEVQRRLVGRETTAATIESGNDDPDLFDPSDWPRSAESRRK